jgi:hypothetical protein
MPQVLPGGTGGPRLRAASGGVSGDAVTSVALVPAMTAAILRRGGASEVCTDPSFYPVPLNLPRLLRGSQVLPAHLSRPAFRGADGRGPDGMWRA